MSISDLVEMRADTDEERTLLWHVRGACHDGSKCLLCQASARANQAELRLESVISGASVPKMTATRAPYTPLVQMVAAFHVAIPRGTHIHSARLETLKWMREQETATGKVPGTESIRDFYGECMGTPDESSGC